LRKKENGKGVFPREIKRSVVAPQQKTKTILVHFKYLKTAFAE